MEYWRNSFKQLRVDLYNRAKENIIMHIYIDVIGIWEMIFDFPVHILFEKHPVFVDLGV